MRRGYRPAVVTLDELVDRDGIRMTATLDDKAIQDGSTADLILAVPDLFAHLTAVIEREPGDVELTGTPAGTGVGRRPQRCLGPGQTLRQQDRGSGSIQQSPATSWQPLASPGSSVRSHRGDPHRPRLVEC